MTNRTSSWRPSASASCGVPRKRGARLGIATRSQRRTDTGDVLGQRLRRSPDDSAVHRRAHLFARSPARSELRRSSVGAKCADQPQFPPRAREALARASPMDADRTARSYGQWWIQDRPQSSARHSQIGELAAATRPATGNPSAEEQRFLEPRRDPTMPTRSQTSIGRLASVPPCTTDVRRNTVAGQSATSHDQRS